MTEESKYYLKFSTMLKGVKMNWKISMTLPVIAMMLLYGCASSNDLFRAPTVGIPYGSQVPILVKGISQGKVRIEYRKTVDPFVSFSEWGQLSDKNSLTTNLFLKDLDAGTDYTYRIEFEDESYSKWFKFKTFPEQGKAGKFNFIFSSCVREKYLGYNVFGQIEQLSPSFVALLGDQMYADYDGDVNKIELHRTNDSLRQAIVKKGEVILNDKTVLQAFRNKYNRVFDTNFQNMASSIPLAAIWDDHDFGKDNSDSTYRYKEEAKKVFKENYPDYSFIQKDRGIYYKFSIADVDIFVLDTRWYRSPMQTEDGGWKTMLGDEQLEWLLKELKNSKAVLKIVLSSVSFNDYGGDTSSDRVGYDNWSGYKFERHKILSFINENDINGVVVFSGDQHYPSAHILNWKKPLSPISRTDNSTEYSLSDIGPVVFDFSASPLSYKIATGDTLKIDNQKNPQYSFEIFRPVWAMPDKVKKDDNIVITSVFGIAEIDTESIPVKISVRFFELDSKTSAMVEIYKTTVTY
ncbi:MAG: alkaline phosphatase D family protein [Bacteroidetes bacterium]|nr:alkaline phosphatase D family protein [Bacteroidota bacterium]